MTDFLPGRMSAVIPQGTVGRASIVHDSPDQFMRLRAAMAGMPLNEEKYARLLIDGSVWMTDAEYEWRTNQSAVSAAVGDVLIAGLGIGFILRPMLAKAGVSSITVIERDADVIALVAPHFPSVRVIEADAYTWTPPKKAFDCVYLDIWQNVPNADDWEDIKRLKRKYRAALRKGGWIAAWCEWKARP